jgi:hypothetical protein
MNHTQLIPTHPPLITLTHPSHPPICVYCESKGFHFVCVQDTSDKLLKYILYNNYDGGKLLSPQTPQRGKTWN